MAAAAVLVPPTAASTDLLKCGICMIEFMLSDIVAFVQHKIDSCRRTTAAAADLECSHCSGRFSSHKTLVEHVQFVHSIRIFNASSASEGRMTIVRLNEEEEPAAESDDAIALETNQTIFTLTNEAEVTETSRTEASELRKFKCGECPAAYLQKIHLVKHSAKHTGIKPFKCSVGQCGYSTVEKSHLKTHATVHLREKLKEALAGAKPLPSAEVDALKREIERRTAEVRLRTTRLIYKCPECPAVYHQKVHLRKHSAKHTGIKPFKCDSCAYSTVEKSHLTVHKRTHSGERPFKCQHCPYSTIQNSKLTSHRIRHHLDRTDPSPAPPEPLKPPSGLWKRQRAVKPVRRAL